MLRASFLVLLTCACVPALAQNGRGSMPGSSTACQEIADKTADSVLPPDTRNRAARTAVRSKYASPSTPAASPSGPSTSQGGGDDGDTAPALPRARGPKWHSFLPGMFR